MPNEILLTRKEKFQFSISGKANEYDWLSEILSNKTKYPIQNRSGKVLRWLEYLYNSGKWNDVVQLKLLSIEHLIYPDDILNGKDSIQQVIKRTRVRQSYDVTPLAEAPEWINELPKTIKLLNTSYELVKHGMEMEICLDRDGYRERYIDNVKRNQSFILAITTNKEKSTVELNRRLNVVQHTGYKNKSPHRRNVNLLYAFLKRVSKKYNNEQHYIFTLPESIPTDFINVEIDYYRNVVNAEAARLNAIIEINRARTEIYRSQVDAELARIRSIELLNSHRPEPMLIPDGYRLLYDVSSQ